MNEIVFNAVKNVLENTGDLTYQQMVGRIYTVLLRGELKEAIVDFRPFVDVADVQSAAEYIVNNYMETR